MCYSVLIPFDGFKGKVLKECTTQLGHVFTPLFQLFLNHSSVPRTCKTSTIIPVLKKSNANPDNDYRPIALTSILCKCMERVVGNQLKEQTANHLDRLQFAYRAQRGVEDASLTLVNKSLSIFNRHFFWKKSITFGEGTRCKPGSRQRMLFIQAGATSQEVRDEKYRWGRQESLLKKPEADQNQKADKQRKTEGQAKLKNQHKGYFTKSQYNWCTDNSQKYDQRSDGESKQRVRLYAEGN